MKCNLMIGVLLNVLSTFYMQGAQGVVPEELPIITETRQTRKNLRLLLKRFGEETKVVYTGGYGDFSITKGPQYDKARAGVILTARHLRTQRADLAIAEHHASTPEEMRLIQDELGKTDSLLGKCNAGGFPLDHPEIALKALHTPPVVPNNALGG